LWSGRATALAASCGAQCRRGTVLVLEKAPEEMRGGNTHYSGGLLRIAFDNVEEICACAEGANSKVCRRCRTVSARRFLVGFAPDDE
jgi:tricarballylate dehydrogenase